MKIVKRIYHAIVLILMVISLWYTFHLLEEISQLKAELEVAEQNFVQCGINLNREIHKECYKCEYGE